MYLTKSSFKIGLSCPTKLYYDSFPKDYHNNDEGNEFMQALAKGGLQVGELAKLYFPGGIEIDGESKQKQLEQTKSALKKENVILYEAALLVDHKFIRIDIFIISIRSYHPNNWCRFYWPIISLIIQRDIS